MSLGKQAVQGAVWNYTGFLLSKGILFVATLIYARILSPAEFGLVGMALLVITVFDVLRDFGIGAALIQRQQDSKATAEVAFALSSAIGVVLFVANWLLAPLTAQFFQTSGPDQADLLVWLVRVLGLSLLFVSLGSTQDALLQKELNYRRRIAPEVTRTAIKGLLSIGLALSGWGVWSLVLGQVAGDGCATLLLWQVSRWRPTFRPQLKLLPPILRYGGQIMLVGGLGWLISDTDYLIIGNMLGESALGIYTLAFRIPELIVRNLAQSVSTVAFPVAAKLQHDLSALRDAYLSMQHYMLLVLAPLGLGLCAISPALVHLLFPAKWEEAIPIMQLLSIYMVIGGITHWPGVVYKAVGRPDILNMLAFVKLAMLVPALWWAAANYGLMGVAWGQVIVRTAGVTIDMVAVSRFVNVSLRANLRAISAPLIAAVLMIVAVRLVFVTDPSETSLAVMLLAIAVGAAVYGVIIWVLDRAAVTSLLAMGRGLVRRGQPRQVTAPLGDAPDLD